MKKKIIALIFILIALTGAVSIFLVWNGIILLNNPSEEKYPVRGVDVSSYQGKIDWQVLSSQNISFAFIKATEGSTYVDECFENNYTQAQKTNLRIGAYHFFSFDSSGKTQAENFITTVPLIQNMLPPVVDLEFYSDNKNNPPETENVRKQLDDLLKKLEEYYSLKPIIYATQKSYSMYLSENYMEYDIWIRNVISLPSLDDSRKWTFWQFTNREKLNGYDGKEKFIDLNVFNGTTDDFNNYAK